MRDIVQWCFDWVLVAESLVTYREPQRSIVVSHHLQHPSWGSYILGSFEAVSNERCALGNSPIKELPIWLRVDTKIILTVDETRIDEKVPGFQETYILAEWAGCVSRNCGLQGFFDKGTAITR